ncbi:MmcQ/YjbR family DNA-binding protein [Dankookia sp. P2]|uniref:MmcQ/YjbR family DNA-binding protein n=1 Tax=Dankookia sp. P2 TaxID=3423955 RepID=UPI003D676FDE
MRGRIFAMAPGQGRDLAAWCKAPSGAQQVLVGADPDRFFAPPYLGPKGWIGVWLHPPPDWTEVAGLVRRSSRLVALKRLAMQAGGEEDLEETR